MDRGVAWPGLARRGREWIKKDGLGAAGGAWHGADRTGLEWRSGRPGQARRGWDRDRRGMERQAWRGADGKEKERIGAAGGARRGKDRIGRDWTGAAGMEVT